MAWVTKVLQVLDEHKDKEGVLRSRWEIVRPENEETGKHFAEALQKTGYYMKNGELTRGYAQALTKYDLRYIRDNWSRIGEALDPPPGATPAPAKAAPATAKEPESDSIDDTPF